MGRGWVARRTRGGRVAGGSHALRPPARALALIRSCGWGRPGPRGRVEIGCERSECLLQILVALRVLCQPIQGVGPAAERHGL
eukprot:2981049-Pyramimonas_sp.AAC.1